MNETQSPAAERDYLKPVLALLVALALVAVALVGWTNYRQAAEHRQAEERGRHAFSCATVRGC